MYRVRRNKLMCSSCRYEWRPDRLPLRLRNDQWETILRHFIADHCSNRISRETHIERRRILRALLVLRRVIANDLVSCLDGCIIDILDGLSEAYPLEETRRRPLYVFLCQRKEIYATAVPEEGRSRLVEELMGSKVCFSVAQWREGVDVKTRRYTHRVHQFENEGQIDLVNRFWKYLWGSLIGRGGIRYRRLPLYLAEYAWKFNHRNTSKVRQRKLLLDLLSY
ncbi:hypothetical protein KAU45_06750 [bacterium]|nr:hypothetical protein [bacterium]